MLNPDIEHNRFHYETEAIKVLSDVDTTEIGFILGTVSSSSVFLPL
jgi:hypothetical protein